MAVIIKLRQRLGIVLLFVIGLGIIGFLLMDINSQSQNRATPRVVGKVNGQELTIQEFEQKVQESIDNYKQSQQQATIDEETRQFLRRQTWNQHVENTILREKYSNLGITITGDEIFSLIKGPNPHPAIRRAFSNPQTGEYNPQQVLNIIRNLDRDPSGERRKQWLSFENSLKENRLRTKYTTLVRKGLYVPQWQAEFEYQIQNATADMNYVQLPYTGISNDQIQVTESEMKEYIQEHKEEYQQEESRSIKYVSFDISPSAADSAKALKWLQGKREQFAEAEKDSNFIRLYSDQSFDAAYHTREELESPIADTLFTIDTNKIIGPYIESSYYKYTKVLDRKKIADSVRASHILITATRQNIQQQRQLWDSLHTQIQEGKATLEELARQHSQDQATANKGGSLGWVKKGELHPAINNALFYRGEEGDVMKVGSNRGFHIIKIDEANPTKTGVQTAELAKSIVASSETEKRVYAKASEFASNNRTVASLDSAASANDLNVRKAPNLKENDHSILGLGQAREVVKWAYNADEGDVSSAFYLGDKYAVAALTQKKKEGTAPLANIRTEIEVKVRQQKKAKKLADRLKQAKSSASSLREVGQAVNAEVQSAIGVSISNPNLGDAGSEPNVAARAIALEEGSLSKPIQGNNGVYMIEVTSLSTPSQTRGIAMFRQQEAQQLQQKTQQGLMESLRESSNIQDNRSQFY